MFTKRSINTFNFKTIGKHFAVCSAIALTTIACGNVGAKMEGAETVSDANVMPTSHLSVNITETGDANSCLIDTYISIDKDANLYMIEYDKVINGIESRVPGQIQFSSHDGLDVSRERGGSGIYEEAPCNTFDVVWQNFECKSNDRKIVPCPEVKFFGPHSFKSIVAIVN